MTFVRRKLNVTFGLGEGSFGESGSQTVKIEGLRVAAHIVKGVGPAMSRAQITIYGMTMSKMNQLSTQGMIILPSDKKKRNTVMIEAGDEGGAMTMVFYGDIGRAYEDMQGSPDVSFQIESYTALYESVKPAEPSSYGEGAKAATMMQEQASKMGMTFENNGVDTVLSYQYLWGSARAQAQRIADNSRFNVIYDDKTLAIWPRGQSRGSDVIEVNPSTGMIRYPIYTSKGIMVRTQFNPKITYGTKINVTSHLKAACGEWVIFALDYDLQSETPNGLWEAKLVAARPGLVPLRGTS